MQFISKLFVLKTRCPNHRLVPLAYCYISTTVQTSVLEVQQLSTCHIFISVLPTFNHQHHLSLISYVIETVVLIVLFCSFTNWTITSINFKIYLDFQSCKFKIYFIAQYAIACKFSITKLSIFASSR